MKYPHVSGYRDVVLYKKIVALTFGGHDQEYLVGQGMKLQSDVVLYKMEQQLTVLIASFLPAAIAGGIFRMLLSVSTHILRAFDFPPEGFVILAGFAVNRIDLQLRFTALLATAILTVRIRTDGLLGIIGDRRKVLLAKGTLTKHSVPPGIIGLGGDAPFFCRNQESGECYSIEFSIA